METGDRRSTADFASQFHAYVTPYRFLMDDEGRRRGASPLIRKDFLRIPPRSLDPTAKKFLWEGVSRHRGSVPKAALLERVAFSGRSG